MQLQTKKLNYSFFKCHTANNKSQKKRKKVTHKMVVLDITSDKIFADLYPCGLEIYLRTFMMDQKKKN